MKKGEKSAARLGLEKLAHGMDYPIDSLLDAPGIHVIARDTLVVEGCRGVLVYSDTKLSLDLGKFALTIHGNELLLRNLSKTELTVQGDLTALLFDGKLDGEAE